MTRIKQGIAPWRGIADALLSVDFFLILGVAIQNGRCTTSTYVCVPCLFLEQAIKCGAGVASIARCLARSVFGAPTQSSGGLRIASHRYARREKVTRVGLVLERDANRDRPHTLESRRGLEIHALLATVQSCVALRTFTLEVYIRR
jgi:hypothetical protein